MKRLIATLVCLVTLSGAAVSVEAQTRNRSANRRTAQNTRYAHRYDNNVYRENTTHNDNYSYGRDRSVWDKHRDKITTAGGALGGAVLGGLIGGRKGALIGAITGGAGAGIYTYKIRNQEGKIRNQERRF